MEHNFHVHRTYHVLFALQSKVRSMSILQMGKLSMEELRKLIKVPGLGGSKTCT